MPEIDADSLIEIPNGLDIVQQQEEVELDDEETHTFVELMQVGKKVVDIQVFGHPAVISTLTNEEEIALGFALAKYQEIPTITRAYKACVVAASLRSIDDREIYTPLSSSMEPAEIIKEKLKLVNKYSAVVVDKLYDEIALMNQEVVSLWEKLGKASS